MDIYGSSPLPYWTLTKPGGPCSVERGRLMEGGEQSGTGMEFGQPAVLRKPTPSRPQPNMRGGGPGDMGMSLLSQGFGGGDQESDRSFTHMLAGATSPPSSEDGKGGGAMDTDGMNLGVRALGGGGGSFADRLAARAKDMGDMGGGMGGGGLANHAKLMPPSRIAMPQQMPDFHQLTIPPGLSPGQLLDSPVFCNPQQAEPSPTTGTFPVSYLTDPSKDKTNDQGSTPGFVFKPFAVNVMRNPLSPLSQPALISHQFAQSQSMQQSHSQAHSGGQSGQHSHMGTSSASLAVHAQAMNNNSGQNSSMPMAVALSMPSNRQQPERSSESQQTPSPERDSQPAPQIPTYIERPSEDGYNWRKYGQKQVKGSEYPRSYYKCTQANCPMKKKVERSLDGQVTEIVYKGEHNHPKPQPTRRLAVAAAQLISDNSSDRADGDDKWGGFQTHGEYGVKHDRGDDPSSSLRGRVPLGFSLGQNGTPEPSSPSTSEDGSKSMEDGDEEDGPDAKRRKKEKRAFKEQLPPSAPRTIREPRVVVQTTSDVDILDDGYRWRKYGQKVVKGNPHPRSYYKCTNLGCPVRKHVERASNDPKAVITTYEGKHNHDVPVARNSSHDNAGAGANSVSAASQSAASSVTHSGPPSQQQQGYGRRMSSVFGRLLEDGSKGGDSAGSDVDLGMGIGMGQSMRNMDGSGGSNPANGDLPVSTSITMNVQQSLGHRSGLMSLDSYGGGSSQHDSLRPKQEQDESHHQNGGLQPNNVYHPQRLVLGP